jgi:hypothetical protein
LFKRGTRCRILASSRIGLGGEDRDDGLFLPSSLEENDMAKMSMKQFEKSAADKKMDKKLGYKEGSKKDNAADRKALAKINEKRKK